MREGDSRSRVEREEEDESGGRATELDLATLGLLGPGLPDVTTYVLNFVIVRRPTEVIPGVERHSRLDAPSPSPVQPGLQYCSFIRGRRVGSRVGSFAFHQIMSRLVR